MSRHARTRLGAAGHDEPWVETREVCEPGQEAHHRDAVFTARVERNFTLDPHDPKLLTARVPAGYTRVDANASWILYAHC